MKIVRASAGAAFVLVLLVSVGLPRAARAGGYELSPQSAEASGAADAATARASTPAAAHFNPAALVDGDGFRLGANASLALSSIDAEATANSLDGPWAASTVSHPSVIPALYASYADEDWMVALAVHVPFGSHVEWPAAWPQRFDAIVSSLLVARIAPSFGWRFDRVRIAGGVHLNLGELESSRATNHILDEGSVHLRMDGVSVGGHLGLFAELSPRVDLGLSYQSRSRIRMKGEADFEVPPEFEPRFPDQSVRTEFPLPDRIALGARIGAGDAVDLYTDLSVTLWSVNDVLVIDFEDELTDDSVRPSHWRPTAALRVGADVHVVPELVARAGVFVDGLFGPTAPAEYLTPTSPDAVRIGGSFGASYAPSEGFAVDAFYQYLRLLERESTSQDAPLARYQGHAHILGLGARFFYGVEQDASAPEVSR